MWRTKFPYLGLGASALMAVIAWRSVEVMGTRGAITGPAYFTASINMSSTIIIPIFATIFAAMSVASETNRGTLRTLLVRPVTRANFLTAKLLTANFYLLLLFAANIAVALVIASGYPIKTALDANISIPGLGEQIAIYGFALLLTILPQVATVCFGFFISAMSSNVGTAIGVSVGLFFSIFTAKQFVHIGSFDLDQWIFTSYFDTAMGIADSKAGGMYESWGKPQIYMLVGTSLASIGIFLKISYRSFVRRDLNGF